MSTPPTSAAASASRPMPPPDEQRPSKRRRRALSCTECIRRKTRCSAIGTVPCESCVKRGRSEDCKWENGEGEGAQDAKPSWANAEELTALREEVQLLKATLDAHLAHCSSGARAASSPFALPSIGPPAPTPASIADHTSRIVLPSIQELDRRVETAVAGLEELVTSGGRPEAQHIAFNLPANPFGSPPSSSVPSLRNVSSSRLPPMVDNGPSLTNVQWASIGAILPSRGASQLLVEGYLASPYHKSWHVLLSSAFRNEHVAFCTQSATPQGLRQSDPAWVALYLMVIAFAVKSLTLMDVIRLWPTYDLQEAARLPRALYEASLLAIKIGRCDAVPQIRHVQTCLLYVTFLFHFGTASEGTTAMQHLGTAISALQWLGLDQLGDNPTKLSTTDAALRNLPLHVAFELVKLLFHSASLLDGTMSRRLAVCRLADSLSSPNATALPRLWDDTELSSSLVDRKPKSAWVDSSTAFFGSQFGTENRKFLKAVEENGNVATLELVLQYDEGLTRVLAQIPCPKPDPADYRPWMQCTTISSIHNRLLRAHRPFMYQGYTDKRFAFSTRAALDSAKAIITTQRLMMDCPQYRPTFAIKWVLGAAFVLATDFAIAIASPLSTAASFADKRRDILHALEIFRQPNPADPAPDVTDQCARTVQALLETMSRRLAARAQVKEGEKVEPDLAGFFQQVKELLTHFTDEIASSPSAAPTPSQDDPAHDPALDFDWSLLVNSGAFPDGMNMEQASLFLASAALSGFRLQ